MVVQPSNAGVQQHPSQNVMSTLLAENSFDDMSLLTLFVILHFVADSILKLHIIGTHGVMEILEDMF